jgi:ornithine cyclodeaminase/alanine dehydrogenase-like protein (mu-crystallin family)
MTGHPFAGRRTRIVGMADVAAVLDMRTTMEVQRAAFVAQAAGAVTATPNSWLRLPEQERRRGWLKILAGHDASGGALGVKVLARFADNPPGANLGSLVLLFDDEDGFPVAVIDGVLITAMRTGAGAGLATEALAAPDPRRLGLVGTGVVAWHSAQATLLARPSIGEVAVYSRSVERRKQLAERIAAEFGIAAEAADSVEEAVDGAEVLITATNAPEAVIQPGHLTPGQHVNAMGIRHEIAPAALAGTWIVPDGVAEAVDDGKFSVGLAAGALRREDLGPELGEVLRQPERAWHDPGRVSLFDSSGIVVQDLALARHVVDLAAERRLGTQVDLGLASGLV